MTSVAAEQASRLMDRKLIAAELGAFAGACVAVRSGAWLSQADAVERPLAASVCCIGDGCEPAFPTNPDEGRGGAVTDKGSLPQALLAKLETLRRAGNERSAVAGSSTQSEGFPAGNDGKAGRS